MQTILVSKELQLERLVQPHSIHAVSACSLLNCQHATRGTQQEYSSKPLIYSIVEHILVFKRWIQAYFYPLKIFHLFRFPS